MISWSGFSPVGDEEDYLLDALSSGWVSGGDYVVKLEQALATTFDACGALAVSNGTSALQLAYQTVGAKAGDKVVVPAFCFQAAANVALQLGMSPVFCDVDQTTWSQSVATIDRVVSDDTAGIVIVHNYGVAAPSEEICRYAQERGIWVIEDCAEAWFSRCNDRYVGQFGRVATFSMHATKTIACGEGGVVLINDESLLERATLFRSHGLARRDRHYFHVLPGNNYRLSNLLSAVAFAQFEKRKTILAKQRSASRLYSELLADRRAIETQGSCADQSEDEIWATAIRVDFESLRICRDEMIELMAARGIEVRPGFYAASALPYFSHCKGLKAPIADRLAQDVLVLPTNASVQEGDVRRVCGEIVDIIDGYGKET